MPELAPVPFDEPVELAEYTPEWESHFQEEIERISVALGEVGGETIVDMQHFGSTSIQGLAAKPIVGILMGIATREPQDELVEALQALGYLYFGSMGKRPRWYLRIRGERNFNIHIVQHNGSVWHDNLLFRDFLNQHEDWRANYEQEKRIGAEAYQHSVNEYGGHKNKIMKRIMRQAYAWESKQANATALQALIGGGRGEITGIAQTEEHNPHAFELSFADGSVQRMEITNARCSPHTHFRFNFTDGV